ncbi:MAG TPA: preprotein translocase subunit YajC, partial [Lachnospiraceae bacterium]|nr:preprotein translocase subunit YajC [Lachnospiraceae bacterium]
MSILLTASESASAGSMIPLILMYVVVFGVFFYFVLYRPQKKEQKKTSAMLSTLEIG